MNVDTTSLPVRDGLRFPPFQKNKEYGLCLYVPVRTYVRTSDRRHKLRSLPVPKQYVLNFSNTAPFVSFLLSSHVCRRLSTSGACPLSHFCWCPVMYRDDHNDSRKEMEKENLLTNLICSIVATDTTFSLFYGSAVLQE
jgi:hypothetical protein